MQTFLFALSPFHISQMRAAAVQKSDPKHRKEIYISDQRKHYHKTRKKPHKHTTHNGFISIFYLFLVVFFSFIHHRIHKLRSKLEVGQQNKCLLVALKFIWWKIQVTFFLHIIFSKPKEVCNFLVCSGEMCKK